MSQECANHADRQFIEPEPCPFAGQRLDLCAQGMFKGCYCAKHRGDL